MELNRVYKLPRDSCDIASEEGHLEVLKWLREQGCPWDTYTCSMAALGGHLEVLNGLERTVVIGMRILVLVPL